MKKILAIIILLLFLLLLWWTKAGFDKCCNGNDVVKEKTVEKAVEAVKDGPLVYDWNSNNAITNDLWPAKKASILSGMADGKILKIVGPYFSDEGKEMGIARAKSAYAKLADKIDASKVEYGAKLVDFYDDAKTKRFAHTDFNWVVRNENIQEVDNKALIYFPTNSTSKIENKNITSYLNDVASSLKGNKKTVLLTGHTDSRGNDAANKKLAQGRANSIKAYLVNKGVAANRISATSKGETSPIASNDTEDGRQKNRRVELEIK